MPFMSACISRDEWGKNNPDLLLKPFRVNIIQHLGHFLGKVGLFDHFFRSAESENSDRLPLLHVARAHLEPYGNALSKT